MSVPTFTKSGAKATNPATLDKSVFSLEVTNHQLLKDAYVAYLANGRSNNAITKTRGEVRGGGKKPWKQKGTGRARFGSSRVPIWRGGGITFGPTGNENYSKRLNVKAKRKAIRQAFSLASASGKIRIIESFDFNDGKVKPIAALLDKLNAQGSILIILSTKDEIAERATRNLAEVKAIQANYANVYDVMNADTIIASKKSLDVLSDWLGEKA